MDGWVDGWMGGCGGSTSSFVGWLVGYWIGWLAGWLVGWLVGWLAGWLVVPCLTTSTLSMLIRAPYLPTDPSQQVTMHPTGITRAKLNKSTNQPGN